MKDLRLKPLKDKLYFCFLILIFLSSCSFNKQFIRESPDFSEKHKKIKDYTVVPVEISIFETSSDGSNTKKEEWSSLAKENLMKAIEDKIEKDNIHVGRLKDASLPINSNLILRDMRIHYVAIEERILNTIPGRPEYVQRNADKLHYSLGSDIKLLNEETDAFLLVRAFSQIYTRDRSFSKNATDIAEVIAGGVLFEIATGGRVNPAFIFNNHSEENYSFLSIALVDSKTGEVLWYNFEFSKKKTKYDLLKADSTQEMVGKVLSNLE
jgi:hypothetical protein